MSATHTETTDDGYTIKIFLDEDSINPFEDWDCLPDIIGWHRRYDFNTRREDGRKTAEAFLEEAESEGYIFAPLYMYDHSGLAFSTWAFSTGAFPCPWDSGQYGFLFWTPERIKHVFGFVAPYTPEQEAEVRASFEAACRLLTDYANGNAYGFVIKDEEGEDKGSCWDFFGDYEADGGALTAARESLEEIRKRDDARKAQEAREAMAYAQSC